MSISGLDKIIFVYSVHESTGKKKITDPIQMPYVVLKSKAGSSIGQHSPQKNQYEQIPLLKFNPFSKFYHLEMLKWAFCSISKMVYNNNMHKTGFLKDSETYGSDSLCKCYLKDFLKNSDHIGVDRCSLFFFKNDLYFEVTEYSCIL